MLALREISTGLLYRAVDGYVWTFVHESRAKSFIERQGLKGYEIVPR